MRRASTFRSEARKRTGSHYTPPALARFVAAQIAGAAEVRGPVRVLDPAVGDGELLAALIAELTAQGGAVGEAAGYETDPTALCLASRRLNQAFPAIRASLREADFLEVVVEAPYDLIIANPPYVRTQVLGAERSQTLACQFGLTGRVDLYHAFLEAMAKALRPGGVAGVIVSNRFMTTRAGASVRSGILRRFDVLHVFDLGDTKLFEAAVLPAVLLLRRKDGADRGGPAGFTSIYTTGEDAVRHRATDPVAALACEGVVHVDSGERFRVRKGRLDASDVWRIATDESGDWLRRVEVNTWRTFGEIGHIRVGVKTTADKVFIRSDWETRPELLRPLTTHHVARRYKPLAQPRREILYPHCVVDGRREVADLDRFPRTAAYLEQHRAMLERRTYVAQAGRRWYEIWVTQDPGLWRQPKLVFRDIAETPTFWMDVEGTVVNGDCYWLTCREPDLLWLALAVGNSSFIEVFYDHRFHNKLYSGRRRFMTQYVQAFPLPSPDTPVARKIVGKTHQLFDLIPSAEAIPLESEIDALVWEAFQVEPAGRVARGR